MAVDVKEFEIKKLNPEYRGWTGPYDRATKVLGKAVELVRTGKVKEVIIAKKSVDGSFATLKAGIDQGKLFLYRDQYENMEGDTAFKAAVIEKERGRQKAAVQVIISQSQQQQQEETVADFIDRIEEYKSTPGATMITGQWEDATWIPSAKYRVMHELVIKKNPSGWVEEWRVEQGRFAPTGKKIPVTRSPLVVIGGSK